MVPPSTRGSDDCTCRYLQCLLQGPRPTAATSPIAALKATIEKAGYAAKELQDVRSKSAPRVPTWWPVAVGGALTLPLVMPMLLQLFGIDWMLDGWLQLALATPVQFASVNTTSRLGLPRASGDGPYFPTGSGVLSAAIWALYQYQHLYLNIDKGKHYIDMADTAKGVAD